MKHLIEKKQDLENELNKINNQINVEMLRCDFEEIKLITDNLHKIVNSNVVKKYGEDFWNDSKNAFTKLHDALAILSLCAIQLKEEINALEQE
jgi:hypothetical protein